MPRILDRGAIGIIDLRPAGNTGLHHVPFGVIRDMFIKISDELRDLGARPDKAHLALQHGPELWQFVDPHLADETANPGDTRIINARPLCPVLLCILRHRAQFDHREGLTEQTDAGLTKESRAFAFQPHQQREDRDNREGRQQ